MKYRIFEKGNGYKLQRKQSFFDKWTWVDVCDKWCNWYGRQHPKFFCTKEDVAEFIENQEADKKHPESFVLETERAKLFIKEVLKDYVKKDELTFYRAIVTNNFKGIRQIVKGVNDFIGTEAIYKKDGWIVQKIKKGGKKK